MYFLENVKSNASVINVLFSFFAATQCDKRFGFECDNGYCIHTRLQCDGNNNCGDFSDEQSCGTGSKWC